MIHRAPRAFLWFCTALLAALLAGCGPATDGDEGPAASGVKDDPRADHSHGEDARDEHTHHHEAPHGGTLVALGDHVAHIELVLDADDGALTLYVLDGDAENAVRLAASDLAVAIDPGSGDPLELRLTAVANVLTGETVGDTSEFSVRSEALKGRTRFEARIEAVSVRGVEFHDIHFRFPDGNEP